ncbi:lung adenoma susceptibility protein 2 isoform X2 [Hemicordylus capensis]|uniref:lung adenoma susceptibility protein 2 isoform X2 n=1 Tax=Hemicordylus capensis TaxID=884348 RepID=UPI002302C440|nr:lung adenoma susceptibility protein 2 isoform X2 [Hemicordylus capensis]
MACLIKKGSVYSPESTVSSLLANCSLNSSSSSLSSHSSIQYKDKLYRSASQALEAYIEDFDLSRLSPERRPGEICVAQNTPKDFRSSRDGFKHRYDSENFKLHAVLGSVGPRLRRKVAWDPDMLSLTTDDLLAFPADGSASFTHSAASRPVPQSSNLKSLAASVYFDHHRTSSFGNQGEMNFLENPASSLYKDSSRKVHRKHKFHKYDSEASALSLKDHLVEQKDLASTSHKNYPRWLTSQKSDLSISGISSIPDFKYPIWLKSHSLLSDSAPESSTQSDPASLQGSQKLIRNQNEDCPNNSERSGHNGLLDLRNEHDDQRNGQYDIPSVYFAPKELAEHKHLFRDGEDELLLQKAGRILESSAEELTDILKNNGSPCTVDVLEAERSWDNVPFGLKSPVPVFCEEESPLQTPKASIVNEFLEDCLKNGSQESTFSGGNHHGPVEALKLMLFNLQAVQQSFSQNKTAGHDEDFYKISDEDVEFRLCDHDMIPVTKSLQRALHHLSRLKGLVEDIGGKEAEEVTKT